MSQKKVGDSFGKRVVTVACHHVVGIGEVDVLGVRHHFEELGGRFRGHEIARSRTESAKSESRAERRWRGAP